MGSTKMKRAKRVAAIILSAAMLMTESLAVFAEEPAAIPADTEAVYETAEEAEEIAEGISEETVEAEAEEAAEEAVEEEPSEEAMEAEAAEEEDLSAEGLDQGTNAVPAAITGVQVVTDPDMLTGLDSTFPVLLWNPSPGVCRYELQIKDAQNRVYASGTKTTVDGGYTYNYPTSTSSSATPRYTLSPNLSYYAYVEKERVKEGEEKESVRPFAVGQTYTIQVRAVNRFRTDVTKEEYDARVPSDTVSYHTTKDDDNNTVYYKETTFYGPWSGTVTYKAEVSDVIDPVQITGLAATSQNDSTVYFTFDQTFTSGTVYYEYSTDNTFATKKSSSASQGGKTSTTKLSISKYNLEAGTTYYIRAYYQNSRGKYLKDAEGKRVYSNVASFIPTEKEKKEPNLTPQITGLSLVKTTTNEYTFRFATTLDDKNVEWVLEYGEDANFPDGSYTTKYNTLVIYKDDLESGKVYYVRVRSYDDSGLTPVYGEPSNVLTVQKAVGGGTVSLLEQTSGGIVIGYPKDVAKGDIIQVWLSSDPNFQNKPFATATRSFGGGSDRLTLGYGALNNGYIEPGMTIYIKLRSGIETYHGGYKAENYDWGSFSNTLKVKVNPATAYLYNKTVGSKSVELLFDNRGDGPCTGYELQKKNDKVWDELTKTTAYSYTDKKLKPDTEYTYRIRSYYYNNATNKICYGDWTTFTTMTWGQNLNVKAMAKSKTSVKLSWNKVQGASGYEIYRLVTSSAATNYSFKKGAEESYDKYVLLKTQKGNSYVAKGLEAGSNQYFIVKAYKMVKGKKYMISGGAGISLAFDTLDIINTVVVSGGAKKVEWNPVYSANGYQIDIYDQTTKEWKLFKTISKPKTTSAVLPASTTDTLKYRIRAFRKGNPKKYTDAESTIEVNPFLNAPANVKAKALADGSIQVNWSPVPGAKYYKVYRTTDPQYAYNRDSKTYTYYNGEVVSNYIADKASKTGYRRESDVEKLTGTSLVDRRIDYTVNGITTKINGPEPGVKYYYYVVAYTKRTHQENGSVKVLDDYTLYSSESKAAGAIVGSNAKSRALKTPKIAKAGSKKGKVTLSWKAVENAESYVIYRSTKKKKGYVVVGYAENGKTAFTDTNVYKRKTYYYKVKAAIKSQVGLDVVAKKFSGVKAVKVK